VLKAPATAAKQAASAKAMTGPRPSWTFAKLNRIASSTAPTVCPVSRAVPSMPLALPERCSGAVVTMVWLLGDWNRPPGFDSSRQQIAHHSNEINHLAAILASFCNGANRKINRYLLLFYVGVIVVACSLS
jgi:hypothetical protein